MNIPQFGFGTYKISQEDAYDAVRSALEIGYRHIDTAQMYGNEAEVGKAIADSGIDRSEIFLTTKLDNPNHEPQAARDSFALSLEKLEVDYVDLFLIHWPMAKTTDYVETWRTLIEFKDDGRAKNIGVSNFQPDHLHAIISQTGMTPAVNQIELHPYLQQHGLVEYQDEHGIATESWSPLARGKVLNDPVLKEIAEETGASTAQVVIAWHLHKGYIVFPKSAHRERMIENFEAQKLQLSDDQMKRIDSLDRNVRVGSHPDDMELK